MLRSEVIPIDGGERVVLAGLPDLTEWGQPNV